MQSLQSVFSATLEENLDKENLPQIIKELSFELSKKRLQRLKDENKIQKRVGELFEIYCKILEDKELKSSRNISAIIDGLIKATTYEMEDYLYKTIYNKEQLEKSIIKQKDNIKETITQIYDTLDNQIDSLKEEIQPVAKEALNDIKLSGLEMLGILKETTEEAILTTLEKGTDTEETIAQIAKNLTYQSIKDGEFRKKRFLDISRTILLVAVEIADENISFSKDIISGAIEGTKEGISKAIDKFKNDVKFTPDELEDITGVSLQDIKRELLRVEDEFIDMLEELSKESDGVSSQIIKNRVEELDSSIEKLRRTANEAREVLLEKIEEIKSDISFEEIKGKAEQRLETLKKDVINLEKKAEKSLEKITSNEATIKAKKEAKKLGLRAWEVAKNLIDKYKK